MILVATIATNATAATLAAVKNVLGGKYLKTNAAVTNATNAITVALAKDVTGGNFGKIDVVSRPLKMVVATIAVINTVIV